MNCGIRFLLTGLIFLTLSTTTYAQNEDPCQGTILNFFRRPTIMASACTIPYGKFGLDSGVAYIDQSNHSKGFMLPQAKVRIGLPWKNELSLALPNEITSNNQASGLAFTQIYAKHQVFYTDHWNTALRASYIPSSGSRSYGSPHNGYTLNAVLAYRNAPFDASLMFGYSSLVTPQANGGQRYNTLTPDGLVGWQAKEWLQVYGEVYGQLNTGPKQGPGYNLNTGLLFLINKNVAADLELGHRLSGQLNNLQVYYGAGISFMI